MYLFIYVINLLLGLKEKEYKGAGVGLGGSYSIMDAQNQDLHIVQINRHAP